MPNKLRNRTCWLVTEGFAGMENQCLGLAKALDLKFTFKKVDLRFPWKYLPAQLCFPALTYLSAKTASISPPWPKILISCGRMGAIISKAIKKISKEKIFTIHIQNPRTNLRDFDLVIIPKHDGVTGKNVLLSDCAIHHITPKLLKKNKADFNRRFSVLPKPIVGVLVGGSSKSHKFNQSNLTELISKLKDLHNKTGCSFAISSSRRTGEEFVKLIKNSLKKIPKYIWNQKSENPYLGILSSADTIIVTCESVSMISEACATGKPVYLFQYEGKSKRIKKFHEMVYKRGYAKPLNDSLEKWTYKIPNDTKIIASQIKTRFNKVVL